MSEGQVCEVEKPHCWHTLPGTRFHLSESRVCCWCGTTEPVEHGRHKPPDVWAMPTGSSSESEVAPPIRYVDPPGPFKRGPHPPWNPQSEGP